MSKHQLQAFTILEITVTMAVSAILIGLTFTIYSVISRSYSAFNRKNEQTRSIAMLDKLLKRDLSKAENLWQNGTQLLVAGKTDSARYEFRDTLVIRNKGITDTFKVSPQNFTVKFEHREQDLQPESPHLIDEVSFTLAYQGQLIPFFYSKLYSSENLLNLNQTDAHH